MLMKQRRGERNSPLSFALDSCLPLLTYACDGHGLASLDEREREMNQMRAGMLGEVWMGGCSVCLRGVG